MGNGSGGGRGGGGGGGGGGSSGGSGGVSSAYASAPAYWTPHGSVPVMPKAGVTSGPAVSQSHLSPLRSVEVLHGVLPGVQSPPPFGGSAGTTPQRLVATPSSLREAPMLVPIAPAPQLVPLSTFESSPQTHTAPPAVVFIATPEQGWPSHSASRVADKARPPQLHLDSAPSAVTVETTNAVSM